MTRAEFKRVLAAWLLILPLAGLAGIFLTGKDLVCASGQRATAAPAKSNAPRPLLPVSCDAVKLALR
ncbi:hypothetical protein ACFSM5_05025 [Lacibacterium aquatile]|uniref:Uncharacterized protein n=1 Tax=Lacibacterium aquatile TaxID=1168082 RepID=A0ABW5DSH0_9PROT